MFLVNWFQESVMGETLMVLFLVAFIGYLVGSITIKGVELGTAGVLLVALVFGHFLGHDESLVEGLGMFQDLGLICFVTSVGFIAGPKFFRNFKINAKSYILLGFIIIAIGALVTSGIITIAGVPTDITVGMMSGALTSTPGLAAALDATGSANASIGYGIAYPFGVVGVVLFVQLMPKILHTDMDATVPRRSDGIFPVCAGDRSRYRPGEDRDPASGRSTVLFGNVRRPPDRGFDPRSLRPRRKDQLPCGKICA